MKLLLRSPGLFLILFLTACAKQPDTAVLSVNPDDLQTQQWILTAIDNQELDLVNGQKAPSIHIDQTLMATGYSGCNNYFAEAEIKGDQIRLIKMNATMKLCFQGQMERETVVFQVLKDWSTIDIRHGVMKLSGQQHTLSFKATHQ